MEEDQERPKSLVLNSNILFSALIKEEGFTRAALVLLKENKAIKFFIPEAVSKEFKFYAGEIARKSGLTINGVFTGFEKLMENVSKVNEMELKTEIKEALNYVKDEKDTPFVALALKCKPSYILTYNKRHYKVKELKNNDILVLTPKEALDLIGIGRIKLETKEKKKRNLLYYLTKLKVFGKKMKLI